MLLLDDISIILCSGEVSIRHGLQGPNHAVATACAASAHAIGDAYNFIRLVSGDGARVVMQHGTDI